MNREPECYGKMFPSVVEMAHNRSVAGKVFGYELSYPGQVAACRAATVNRGALSGTTRAPGDRPGGKSSAARPLPV